MKWWMHEIMVGRSSECINENSNEWMSQWINENANEWVSLWMNENANERMSQWMNENANEWMNQWMNENANKWIMSWFIQLKDGLLDESEVRFWIPHLSKLLFLLGRS